MSRTSRLGLAAAVTSLALMISACGGDDSATADAAEGNQNENSTVERGEDWPETLEFISIPSEEQTELVQQYEVLLELFEEDLGVTINSTSATSYAAVIEAMNAGNADIANFGPFSYVVAADTAGAQPVAVAINAEGEDPSYVSYLVTQADNDEINSIEDLEGKTVCFVDQVSTSGFLYPTAGLMEAGLEEGDYESVFAGGHDASFISTMNGDCDAGFAYDTMVDVNMTGPEGNYSPDDMKVVWESEDIPSAPFAAHESLPEDMVEAMRDILLTKLNTEWLAENGYCENPEPGSEPENDCSAVVPTADFGYIEVDDSVFDGIRAVCEITEADACTV
ncbi:phosphate/phosphite/phosphonate ABC transporter substrate-binding protein [Nesterenkonia rhizosphaerae]|uniref:Phosphate/phosphite/phosphonate ABC transporter substrate-binding protein n=1 Tax=Nesterenkonia rhizosphaerae TaxID=1348272 RepID=A0ABP9FQF1_9MICC